MVAARTRARLEMTEVCCSTGSGFARGYNPGMIGGIWLADTIWRNLSAGGASSFSWWTALSPELGCPPATDPACPAGANPAGWNDGLLYYDPDFRSDGNQSIYFTRRYWVLANFSRYIRPGAVRYRVANVPSGVHVLAFHRNTWRFVLINDAAGARPVAVRLLPPAGRPGLRTAVGLHDLRHVRPGRGGRAGARPGDEHGHDHPPGSQRDDGHRPRLGMPTGSAPAGRSARRRAVSTVAPSTPAAGRSGSAGSR